MKKFVFLLIALLTTSISFSLNAVVGTDNDVGISVPITTVQTANIYTAQTNLEFMGVVTGPPLNNIGIDTNRRTCYYNANTSTATKHVSYRWINIQKYFTI